jgi:hypothetical protein
MPLPVGVESGMPLPAGGRPLPDIVVVCCVLCRCVKLVVWFGSFHLSCFRRRSSGTVVRVSKSSS